MGRFLPLVFVLCGGFDMPAEESQSTQLPYFHSFSDLDGLEVHAREASIVTDEYGTAVRLDGTTLFEGTHTFTGFDTIETRGWVRLSDHLVSVEAGPGRHQIEVTLGVTEPFGWGFGVTLQGEGVSFPDLVR